MHLFLAYFGIPYGLVWGNVLAEPIIVAATLLILWPKRHALMRKFVAFHHFHKEAHLASLKEKNDETPHRP